MFCFELEDYFSSHECSFTEYVEEETYSSLVLRCYVFFDVFEMGEGEEVIVDRENLEMVVWL